MKQFLLSLIILLLLCTATVAEPIHIKSVTLTQYSWTGYRTSSDVWPYQGCIALSRDLIKRYKLKFGNKIIIPGVGEFIYDDKMPPQWNNRVDIYSSCRKSARKFGKLKNMTIIVTKRR